MYRIVKFVQTEKFDKETEKFYMGILRAQLSSFELLMLFYNINYSEAGEKFKLLLRGRNFFQNHIPKSMFMNTKFDIEIMNDLEGNK